MNKRTIAQFLLVSMLSGMVMPIYPMFGVAARAGARAGARVNARSIAVAAHAAARQSPASRASAQSAVGSARPAAVRTAASAGYNAPAVRQSSVLAHARALSITAAPALRSLGEVGSFSEVGVKKSAAKVSQGQTNFTSGLTKSSKANQPKRSFMAFAVAKKEAAKSSHSKNIQSTPVVSIPMQVSVPGKAFNLRAGLNAPLKVTTPVRSASSRVAMVHPASVKSAPTPVVAIPTRNFTAPAITSPNNYVSTLPLRPQNSIVIAPKAISPIQGHSTALVPYKPTLAHSGTSSFIPGNAYSARVTIPNYQAYDQKLRAVQALAAATPSYNNHARALVPFAGAALPVITTSKALMPYGQSFDLTTIPTPKASGSGGRSSYKPRFDWRKVFEVGTTVSMFATGGLLAKDVFDTFRDILGFGNNRERFKRLMEKAIRAGLVPVLVKADNMPQEFGHSEKDVMVIRKDGMLTQASAQEADQAHALDKAQNQDQRDALLGSGFFDSGARAVVFGSKVHHQGASYYPALVREDEFGLIAEEDSVRVGRDRVSVVGVPGQELLRDDAPDLRSLGEVGQARAINAPSPGANPKAQSAKQAQIGREQSENDMLILSSILTGVEKNQVIVMPLNVISESIRKMLASYNKLAAWCRDYPHLDYVRKDFATSRGAVISTLTMLIKNRTLNYQR